MDIFSTNVLTGVVRSLKANSGFLLAKFFPFVVEEQSEEIHFDIDKGKRRVSPFVSPLVEGKIVSSRGFTAKTFKPAYIKDKRSIDANRGIRRWMGEQVGGSMSPADRLRAMVAFELQDQIDMVRRRMELMAADTLRTGAVTISGEKYPTTAVSYGRAGGLTVTLTGGNRWGQAGINPLNSLQDWAQLVLKESGAMPTEVVMTVDTWKIFRADAEVQKRLDQFRGSSTMVRDAVMESGGTFMGQVDGFNVYVYSDWYIDDNDVEQPILPAGTVLMGSSQIEGTQAYGAIRDEEAGLQAMAYFPKSWVTPDPSVRWLMLQSAPLVVPYRVDASFAATVL